MAKAPQQIDPAVTSRLNEGMDKVAAAMPKLAPAIDAIRNSSLGTKKKGPQEPAAPTAPTWTPERMDPQARAALLQEMIRRSKGNANNATPPASSKGPQSVPPAGGA